MAKLAGKIAVVTGASGGIRSAIASALAEHAALDSLCAERHRANA